MEDKERERGRSPGSSSPGSLAEARRRDIESLNRRQDAQSARSSQLHESHTAQLGDTELSKVVTSKLDPQFPPGATTDFMSFTDADDEMKYRGNSPESKVAISERSPQPRMSTPFSSPAVTTKSALPVIEDTISKGMSKMHKFTLYETQTKYYLVGSDITDRHFRMIQVDRNSVLGQLSIVEDEVVYTKKEMSRLLQTIDDGNRAIGGMKLRLSIWGLLGFIKFTEAYYMVAIVKRQQVAMIGGHYVYQIDGTELFPLTTPSSLFQKNRSAEETRFLAILNSLDLNQSFYFSHTYNITKTLQQNIMHARKVSASRAGSHRTHDYNDMFVWNHHLLSPAVKQMKNPYDWCVPIVHGFIDQSCMSSIVRSSLRFHGLTLRSHECFRAEPFHHTHRSTISLFRRSKVLEARR